MGRIKNLVGQRFGRLTILEFSHLAPNKSKNAYWKCLCDCGTIKLVSSGTLRKGDTTSCGCAKANSGKHLYFIECESFIKIGKADNPELRLRQLQSHNPYALNLLAIFPNLGYLEREVHNLLKDFRHRGEWFRLPGVCEVVDVGVI